MDDCKTVDDVIELVESCKITTFGNTNKKNAVKRTVKSEYTCTRRTKNGSVCHAPKTNTVSCWSHMTADEKDLHKSVKKVSATAVENTHIKSSSKEALRELKDLANE
ncbi:hypothetical protein AX774_g4730 [Zancudomyces culisetae]|uniref:Uncharacterized protein n=1 Tax=Zancudomyces culisetae TaxID=1213189 RepID=A0A1R1PLJ3_ZANCU|nr:hypothetical protein AX774_g4730 [Zancudomyces culisetae]|eukprot:OMH81803.1 hypothetical protein AX774_g4730 [Zancudomyces culisetae]